MKNLFRIYLTFISRNVDISLTIFAFSSLRMFFAFSASGLSFPGRNEEVTKMVANLKSPGDWLRQNYSVSRKCPAPAQNIAQSLM